MTIIIIITKPNKTYICAILLKIWRCTVQTV